MEQQVHLLLLFSNTFPKEDKYQGNIRVSSVHNRYGMREIDAHYSVGDVMEMLNQ